MHHRVVISFHSLWIMCARSDGGAAHLQVGATTLARVLHRLRHEVHAGPAVLLGLDSADDAAVLAAPPPGHVSVQVPHSACAWACVAPHCAPTLLCFRNAA